MSLIEIPPLPPLEGPEVARVIIAEDDLGLRQALVDLIQSDSRFELVATAADAQQAIDRATQLQPDLALLDIKMPNGGGVRATHEIRISSPDTRIVALSAYSDPGTVVEVMAAGAHGYLVKGSSADEILAALNRALEGTSTVSPDIAGDVIAEMAEHVARNNEVQRARYLERERLERVLRGEGFRLAYQPVVDLTTGRVVGVEALSRFSLEPVRGPMEWFAEAEVNGMRVELEVLALRCALAEARRHKSPFFLAVNLSPGTLLTEQYQAALPEDASRLVIEITENAAVEDYAVIGEAIRDLESRGGRIAIDDVGAGYATLRHILRLEPRYIKLDLDLTHRIAGDRRVRALALGLAAFAIELDATLIAEGIETEEQMRTIHACGVHLGQGYHLGRPGEWPAELSR